MTLQDYLRVLREQWLVVVAALLVALAAAAATFFLRPPEYTAKLTLYVSAQTGDSPTAAYQGAQLSEKRVTSYVELVSSPRVIREVAQRLGLDPDALAKNVTASSALDSVLIDVSVVGTDPLQAARIADTVGDVMTGLVAELERPTTPGGVAPVQLRVVQPAPLPQKPSSTGLPATLALGLLAGLAVGVAAALARNALDTSVKTMEQLQALTDAPNLGAVAYDPNVPKRPLTVRDDPHSPRSEAYRQLRTNLQFLDVDSPRRLLTVTSSLPGEGKTTTIANLAVALAAAGLRVVVVEADLRRPALADLLGMDRTVGLTTVLTGRVAPAKALQDWAGRFDVLASGALPPNPSELLGSQHMAGLLAELRNRYDIVLVDTPPLLPVTDAAAVAPATDGVLLVVRYKMTTRPQLQASVAALRAVSAPLLGTVFSMTPRRGPRAYGQYAYYGAQTPTVTDFPSRSGDGAARPTSGPAPRSPAPGSAAG